MAHGAGGKATPDAGRGAVRPVLGGQTLAALGDAGEVEADGVPLAVTTDTYVVKPMRFPGGSIGELAVNGTVNDLAVSGARPLALTLSLVLEEGLAADDLRAEVEAIAAAAEAAGVEIVAGDTKVVERGHADGMYICTTGLGRRDPRARAVAGGRRARRPRAPLRVDRRARDGDHARAGRVRARRGDRVRHAVALACGRRAPGGGGAEPAVHARRHPRRVASVAERARARVGAWPSIVQRAGGAGAPAVAGAAEILGIDPMYVANEGKLVAFVAPKAAEAALAALRAVPGCEQAAEIGEVRTEPPGMVLVETSFGGRRVMDQLVGDPLPRIC